jgi:hypothetical protein
MRRCSGARMKFIAVGGNYAGKIGSTAPCDQD